MGIRIQHIESVPKLEFHTAGLQTITTECQNIDTQIITTPFSYADDSSIIASTILAHEPALALQTATNALHR